VSSCKNRTICFAASKKSRALAFLSTSGRFLPPERPDPGDDPPRRHGKVSTATRALVEIASDRHLRDIPPA
jgi:hypothetical protein